jgi:DNA-binding response OmpR family regulator
MYKVAFLKPERKYDFFAEYISVVETIDLRVIEFNYSELSSFDVYEYDLVIIGVEKVHMSDIEIFLVNIELFFAGVVMMVDSEFSMQRKFMFNQLGVENYFYLPLEMSEFVCYLPWYMDQNAKKHIISYKDITLNIDNRMISRGGIELQLKNMEFRLLKYLLVNKGKIVSKDKIMTDVWDMNSLVNSKTVEVHMCRLRKKIDCNFDEKLLHTIPNTGYMLK